LPSSFDGEYRRLAHEKAREQAHRDLHKRLHDEAHRAHVRAMQAAKTKLIAKLNAAGQAEAHLAVDQ
jgi:hypothetical protein